MVVLELVGPDAAGRVQCARCEHDVTEFVEAEMAYYESLIRVGQRARRAERVRQLQIGAVVLVVLLGLFPATRPVLLHIIAWCGVALLLVGLWRLFTGRL
ncbi:hypothetical protein A5784_14055 [Mycobacterium sp. 852013-50091_SCH5140682]|nr:hypothetical protein A5784_14055 [Mycobacterium sp. 852013-50091_SCH5140682]